VQRLELKAQFSNFEVLNGFARILVVFQVLKKDFMELVKICEKWNKD
jgi:hypothetical protein